MPPIYTVYWRIRFDDDKMIGEVFETKHGRSPTQDEWDAIHDLETRALEHHAGVLLEQFGVTVNPQDTTSFDGGDLNGTATVTEDTLLNRIFTHEDMYRPKDTGSWSLETTQFVSDGPHSQAIMDILHPCDTMILWLDEFPEDVCRRFRQETMHEKV